jgi:hypothetical protein
MQGTAFILVTEYIISGVDDADFRDINAESTGLSYVTYCVSETYKHARYCGIRNEGARIRKYFSNLSAHVRSCPTLLW